jgi:diguanylate cyclase (GGDEF)-like protein/PAS domain S-box-containing protein
LARRPQANESHLVGLEDQLRAAEARYRSLVENLPAVVYTAEFGQAGEWSYVSPQVADLLGFTPEEWLADPQLWFNQIDSSDRHAALEKEEACRTSGEPLESEYRMRTRTGQTVWIRDEATVVRDDDGRALFLQGVLVDITRRKTLESQLQHQSFHDALTGLANRALFLDRVDHAIARHGRSRRPISVLVLDVDDFKIVNESLGHAAGDALLVEIASRLRNCLRPGDTIARMGGDEFAVLLEDILATDATVVAERVMIALDQPLTLLGRRVGARASIGIADSIEGDSAVELLRKADAAMYGAKASGKHRVQLFDPQLDEAALERHELRSDLETAVEGGELVVFYQPIVELSSGRVTSLEALVRWQHPTRGLLLPDRFIDIAEETGAIVPLGRWVLEEACKQTRAWQRELPGSPISISVNLSPRQVKEPGLVDDVAHALEMSGLAPEYLVLEITENVLLEQGEEVGAALRSLKERGVRIAIDDFGTGYSNLGYLRELPIDILKISKPFVDGVGKNDPEGSALARSIIKLGDNLKLQTVAEGIELEGQLSDLQKLGCDCGQGFFLARPVTSLSVAGMMEALSIRLDQDSVLPASA